MTEVQLFVVGQAKKEIDGTEVELGAVAGQRRNLLRLKWTLLLLGRQRRSLLQLKWGLFLLARQRRSKKDDFIGGLHLIEHLILHHYLGDLFCCRGRHQLQLFWEKIDKATLTTHVTTFSAFIITFCTFSGFLIFFCKQNGNKHKEHKD